MAFLRSAIPWLVPITQHQAPRILRQTRLAKMAHFGWVQCFMPTPMAHSPARPTRLSIQIRAHIALSAASARVKWDFGAVQFILDLRVQKSKDPGRRAETVLVGRFSVI